MNGEACERARVCYVDNFTLTRNTRFIPYVWLHVHVRSRVLSTCSNALIGACCLPYSTISARFSPSRCVLVSFSLAYSFQDRTRHQASASSFTSGRSTKPLFYFRLILACALPPVNGELLTENPEHAHTGRLTVLGLSRSGGTGILILRSVVHVFDKLDS